MTLKVLFEDDHYVAVLKPSGLLVQRDSKSDEESLYDIVKRRLGGGFCGIIHRLDKFTEGIVVLAKTSSAAAALSEQIRNHDLEKNYKAVVEGTFSEKAGKLVHYILKKGQKALVFGSPHAEAKKAELQYIVLEERNGRSLISIELLTGRYNQIRAQMAYVRHPIAGDFKYQKSVKKIVSIALAATEFSFKHPFTGEKVELEYGWRHEQWLE